MNQPSQQAIIETICEQYPDANIRAGYASAIWARCGKYGLHEFELALFATRKDDLVAKKPDFDAMLRHLNRAHAASADAAPDNPLDRLLATVRLVNPIRADLDDSGLYAEHERDVESGIRNVLGPVLDPKAEAVLSEIIARRLEFGRKLWKFGCELHGREVPTILRESRTDAADKPGAAPDTDDGRPPQEGDRDR